MSKPPEFNDWPAELWVPFGPYPGVRADEEGDGDSMHLWLDLGVSHYAWIEARLNLVFAHETDDRDPVKRKMAEQSRLHLLELVPKGRQMIVATAKAPLSAERRTFTRYVVDLDPDPSGGVGSINLLMRDWLRSMGYEGGTGYSAQ